MSLAVRSLAPTLAALALVLTACGSDGSDDDKGKLSGADVAAKAEEALNQDQANLAEGEFECPDMDAEEGATATCTRTAHPEGGVYAVLDGEVEITEVDGDDFGLDLQMEDQVKEFGSTGDHLEEGLSPQIESRFGSAPTEISCPDLPGEVGAEVTCDYTVEGEEKQATVTVDEADPATLSMNYTFADA